LYQSFRFLYRVLITNNYVYFTILIDTPQPITHWIYYHPTNLQKINH